MKKMCLAAAHAIAICTASFARKLVDLLLKDQLSQHLETSGLK
jgi:hypothetical protein